METYGTIQQWKKNRFMNFTKNIESADEYRIDQYEMHSEFVLDDYIPLTEYTPKAILMIQKNTGVIIAYAELVDINESLRTINAFMVDSRFRRRGYGKKFITACINKLHITCIEVQKENTAAYNLYTECGFEINEDAGEFWSMKLKDK